MSVMTPANRSQRGHPGRNDLCPCGSGLKHKWCCMETSTGIPARAAWIQARGERILKEHEAAEQRRVEKFGHVRPAIHTNYCGYKVVSIGDQIAFSKAWRTFPDFLADYIKQVLEPAWGKAEIAKPFEARHPIMQWYDVMCSFQQNLQPGTDDLVGFVPNGPTRAYLLLAYDLYTLRHHMALQAAVVRRLKHRDQFQGARHELFTAATCIRADYEIAYEDEGDTTRSHTELIATHRPTGQMIAVEAKSRHRPGVLGYPGERQPIDVLRAGIRRLLKDALAKPVAHPYVIFFDLNLPPFEGQLLTTPWFREIGGTVADLGDKAGNQDAFNLIVFSNQPDHYRTDHAPATGGQILSVVGRNPRIAVAYPTAIKAIHEAASKFGAIPNSFEETE